jgi:phosphatidyl-myo-inositol alpha-mannosyltransferase
VRIALVCPYAFDDPGGAQTHVRELAERLLGKGHAVVVLAPVRAGAPEPWLVPVGRPVDLRYNGSNVPIDPRPWSRRRVREALAAFGPHVVHVHEPMAPSTGLWALLEARVPVVGTFHSGATRARLVDLAAPVLRRVARRLTVRIAVSEAARRFAEPLVGGPFEIVPNGVETARFATAVPADLPAGARLLFVGRLDQRKGFPVAVEAFARLAPIRPGLRLLVAGDGPERIAVDALPADVRPRVTMLGTVSNQDLPRYHAASDIYVGPAIGGESFGIVLVEAMAAGLPVVASGVAGYDEVVHDGVDGLLVPPRDPEALARAIGKVLDDPALARRLGDAGRERAATFDWSVIVERIEAIYEQALRARSTQIP